MKGSSEENVEEKVSQSFSLSAPIVIEEEYDPQEWDDFVSEAVNGTLYHTLKFLSYHPPHRFASHHIVFRRKGHLVGVMPGVEVWEGDQKVWVSHPGASYGGLAYSAQLKYHHLEEMVRCLVTYAKSKGFGAIRMTLPPVIYNSHPQQALDFALWRNGFGVIRTELTQAVSLDPSPEELFNHFVNKTRNAYRKAIKEGCQFRVLDPPNAEELEKFYQILDENRRGLGVKPAHTKEEIALLHQLVPERLMMAVVEREGEMLAGIWNFCCTSTTVLEFYMAHKASAVPFKPVPFLTYHSLIWAKERGFRWMDFGISSIWGEPTWGLLRFKENFNARHFLRQTWEKRLQ